VPQSDKGCRFSAKLIKECWAFGLAVVTNGINYLGGGASLEYIDLSHKIRIRDVITEFEETTSQFLGDGAFS